MSSWPWNGREVIAREHLGRTKQLPCMIRLLMKLGSQCTTSWPQERGRDIITGVCRRMCWSSCCGRWYIKSPQPKTLMISESAR